MTTKTDGGDRELLGLAAKASGELTEAWLGNEAYFDGVLGRWNPLADDGDALRLAVKLHLAVRSIDGRAIAAPYASVKGSVFDYIESFVEFIDRDHNGDANAATRRAIVRAAAEIGRNKS
jgi:hypothetical protein